MPTAPPFATADRSGNVAEGTAGDSDAVWERVWRHAPSVERDDALIARERRGPRWQEIVQRLHRTFGAVKGLRTIELGSGRGDLSVLLAEQGAKVTLLDASSTALTQARRRFDRLGLTADFLEGDLFAPPAACTGSFDVALSSGVIEHFAGDRRTHAVAAHARVLRPGGLTVISVPHARCIPYRLWKCWLEWRRRWPYGFERPYTAREMVRRARSIGLTEVDTCCVGWWHSISAHWARDLLRLDVDWADRRSCLDGWMGLILLMFGRRPPGNGGTSFPQTLTRKTLRSA